VTALIEELALVLADDAVGDEQAEAGAVVLGREVRFEQALPVFLGDAGAVVEDAEVGPVLLPGADLDANVAADWDSIDGVVEQIYHHFAQQRLVGPHGDPLR